MAGERLIILVGTKKGVFLLDGDRERRNFTLRGPYCETWPINHVIGDPLTGAIHAGGGSPWFGPAVWTSHDRGRTWTHSSEGLRNEAESDPVEAVWSLAADDGRLLVGVQPGALFESRDGAKSFTPFPGLQAHPTRPHWNPGGAGLILHSIVTDAERPERIWVGISAAGVFATEDGGLSWEPRNRGTRADFMPDGQKTPEFGQCVHCIVKAPGLPDRLYQQNHCGAYRSDDGGRSWRSIEAGLPSSFGFPAAAHPRDPDTVFLIPLNGDTKGRFMPDASAAVLRSRDGGNSWQAMRAGLPQGSAYFGVLRQAMATDAMEPAGVYFGTSSGTVYASADEGESFAPIAEHLPTIHSIETLMVPA